MKLHETNHLRKLANESGKQMRGPRRTQAKPVTPESPFCQCMHTRLISYDGKKCCSCGKRIENRK